jgi:hypothetical protein
LPELTSKAYTIYNLTGASVGAYTLSSAEIIPVLASNPYYNTFNTPNWGQTLMPSNSVATVWVYGVPVTASAGSQAYRYLFVQPQWITQATSGSAGNMTTATNTEALRLPSELNLGTLTTETPETVCLGKIIIGFTTNWTLRQVTILTGNKYSQIGSPSGNFLSTVATDATITGDGTGASPLSVVSDSSKVPTSRTLTIFGTTYDLSVDRTWVGGGGLTWSAITADQTLAVDNGYLANKASLLILLLPTTSAVGKVIRVAGMNAGLWRITQGANQYIKFGNQASTTGAIGNIASVFTYDAVELVCIEADKGWMVVSSVGNIEIDSGFLIVNKSDALNITESKTVTRI